ncbi:MAG: hypothetical protein Kow0099_02380 [Candidatus Abyssubacteria bacterium]
MAESSDLSRCLQAARDGVIIRVRVQPRALKDEIAGVADERLRIRVKAPPVEGAANDAACGFLSRLFGLAKGEVRLVSGATSRNKRILLAGMEAEAVVARLLGILEAPGEKPCREEKRVARTQEKD